MTHASSNNRIASNSQTKSWRSRLGLAWLCLWLSIAAGFGYRYLANEPTGEVQASIDVSKNSSTAPKTKPIEQIQVGERVAFTINPTESLDTTFSFDVNPRTWRKVTLRTAKHEVVLLRPATWVNEHLVDGASTIMLSVPEIGIDEPAEVVSIWPCPTVPAGEGRIVIGTFTHITSETICMYIDGLDEPIRCTPNHVTWSVEHKDFVEAHELQAGNLILCDDGVRKLVRIEKIAEPIRVYNLEVQGQHVYQVSKLGMLVHNTSFAGMTNNAVNKTISAQQHVLLRQLFKGQSGSGLTRESLEAAAELSRRALANTATSAAQRQLHLTRLQQVTTALKTL